MLEEPPAREPSGPSRPWQLLLVSARTPGALQEAARNLARHLDGRGDGELPDIAHTLQVGRKAFPHRRAVVCRDVAGAIEALGVEGGERGDVDESVERPTVFLLPGECACESAIRADLYRSETSFRQAFDACAAMLQTDAGIDIRSAGAVAGSAEAAPMTFAIEYSLAQLWMAWGIKPAGMISAGVGEYVAACLAGVVTLKDALKLAMLRGRLSPAAAAPGNGAAADSFLTDSFIEAVRRCQLARPRIPYVSGVSGTWITDADAQDPLYWGRQLVGSGQVGEPLVELLKRKAVFLEMGSGSAFSSVVHERSAGLDPEPDTAVIGCLADGGVDGTGAIQLTEALGRLWLRGVAPEWRAYHTGERRRRVPLPGYPFERKRYWVERRTQADAARQAQAQTAATPQRELADWFYVPSWKRSIPPSPTSAGIGAGTDVVFTDRLGLGARLAAELKAAGRQVVCVEAGERFTILGDGSYALDPADRADYDRLLEELRSAGTLPDRIVHLWSTEEPASDRPDDRVRRELDLGMYSVLFLVQALGESRGMPRCRLEIVTSGLHDITGGEIVRPGVAAVAGLCRVVPQEYTFLASRLVDLVPSEWMEAPSLAPLVAEFGTRAPEPLVAYRRRQRWTQTLEPLRLEAPAAPRLKPNGVYLITGGLGAIGLTMAADMAKAVQATLVLVSRTGLPPRDQWAGYTARSGADSVGLRIRAIEEIEQSGGEVIVEQADAADPRQLRALVERAEQRYGHIDGVVHAAGLVSAHAFRPIRSLARADCEAHFGPKRDGVLALDGVLGDRALDFCVLMSSLSGLLGGLGYAAYASANTFMDGFARQRARGGWTSVAWDGWRFGGSAQPASAARMEIGPRDGVDAFRRLLERPDLPEIIVSTGDLEARLAKWVDRGEAREGAPERAADSAPLHPRPPLHIEYAPPGTELERAIAGVWGEVLGVDRIGVNDNFFELGGDSFLGLQVVSRLNTRLGGRISPVSLYEGPTIANLARLIQADEQGQQPSFDGSARRGEQRRDVKRPAARSVVPPTPEGTSDMNTARTTDRHDRGEIAIIGMAGRFPGARSLEAFWENLKDGVESRTIIPDEELKANGLPQAILTHPRYVKSGFLLDDIDQFDAAFFGVNPREAEVLDPQHRLFLESAWEALEHAGYDGETYPGSVAIFGGATFPGYLSNNVMRNAKVVKAMGARQCVHGSVSDYMVTRVSYKLNLKGPGYFVQTACSTSLVAVYMGCQALNTHEADLVLAGGVSVMVPHRGGYFYEEGGMMSPDGICRTFDAKARGTVFGSGVGIVVLKRLRDALADGDTIHAVIKGSATNNDGALKVGFTAPSVTGQAQVIAEAIANAGISPDTISYVEAHGTGTELGDPIEVAALTRAYRASTDRSGFCAIGSVKPNIGHLDAAAGVSSLLKTILALKHRQVPPTINFDQPNAKIDFDDSPFYVNTTLRPWTSDGSPRRAGVSSFGFGGTNAHVILEEAPVQEPSAPARNPNLLVLSARTESALESATTRLAEELGRRASVSLADVAYTLQRGRRPFAYRRAVACSSVDEAIDGLLGRDPRRTFTSHVAAKDRRVVFLFPGQGSQYVNMGLDLYDDEPVFRAIVDDCSTQLQPHLGLDLRDVLYPEGGPSDEAAGRLKQTSVTQAAIFVTEYALARLWMHWGVTPSACLGHSVGELVAACLADVLTLPDALRLVALRGQLMERMPEGVMVAVPLSEDRVRPFLDDGVWLSAINGPALCVVSGPRDRVDDFVQRVAREGVECRALHTSHAFHSGMMEAAVGPFVQAFGQVALSAPRIPFLSNVTGDWITDDLATQPEYWGRHIRQAVRFSDGLGRLLTEPDQLLLEVGPGNTLSGLVRQYTKGQGGHVVVSSLPHAQEQTSDLATMAGALGRLWVNGAGVDWSGLHSGARRRRVPLPTYPFERQRYWVEPDKITRARLRRALAAAAQEDFSDWFHVPSWKRTPAPHSISNNAHAGDDHAPLLFVDAAGVGESVAARLTEAGYEPTVVEAGVGFSRLDDSRYTIDLSSRADYVALMRDLRASERLPRTIGHFWGVTRDAYASARCRVPA